MKKILILLFIALYANSFALTYQDAITDQIKSVFLLTKIPPQPSRSGIPASIGGGLYSTGDNKLGFSSSCFTNSIKAKKFVDQFVSAYKLFPEPTIQKNLYSVRYETGIMLVKQVKNCMVTIIYMGDLEMKNENKMVYIRGELNLLSKLDN